MRWSVATVVIGLTLLATSSQAQQAAGDSLILSSGVAQFRLALGRIVLDPFHYKKVRLQAALGNETEDEEFVCVTANRGTPSLHYLCQRGRCRVTIDTLDTNAVRIESTIEHPSGVIEHLLFDQPAAGAIRIASSFDGDKRQFKTNSLWHLMAEQPILFGQQIKPVLSLIFDAERLQANAREIEAHLKRQVIEQRRFTRADVDKLVHQLGSKRRARRIDAYTQLRDFGVSVLPLLDEIDPERLDLEQRHRINELKKHFDHQRNDTPARIATWLSIDKAYWNATCQNWSQSDRQAANDYLVTAWGDGLRDAGMTSVAESGRVVRQ